MPPPLNIQTCPKFNTIAFSETVLDGIYKIQFFVINLELERKFKTNPCNTALFQRRNGIMTPS